MTPHQRSVLRVARAVRILVKSIDSASRSGRGALDLWTTEAFISYSSKEETLLTLKPRRNLVLDDDLVIPVEAESASYKYKQNYDVASSSSD